MKRILKAITFSVLLAFTTTAPAQPTEEPPFRPMGFVIDLDLSPFFGAELINIGLRGYQYFDDRLFPSSSYDDGALMTLGRFLKWTFADNSLAMFFKAAQHEFFGHGARARELSVDVADLRLDPWAHRTIINAPEFASERLWDRAAIASGGYEGTAVMNSVTQRRWLMGDSMDARESTLYLWSWIDYIQYIFGRQHDERFNMNSDNTTYIGLVNGLYGFNALDRTRLRQRLALSLLDPFAYYSFVNIINYVLTGDTQWKYLTFAWGNYETIPVFRTLLTPWGPEYQLTNYWIQPDTKALVESRLRYSNIGGQQSYGIGVDIEQLWFLRGWTIDGMFDGWRQPRSSAVKKSRIGGSAAVVGHYPWTKQFEWYLVVGYKTAGYKPGESLDTSPIFRGGFKFHL